MCLCVHGLFCSKRRQIADRYNKNGYSQKNIMLKIQISGWMLCKLHFHENPKKEKNLQWWKLNRKRSSSTGNCVMC